MCCLKHLTLCGLVILLCAGSLQAQTPPSRTLQSGGSTGALPSFVRPASFEDVPVYRISIAIITADVSDAGTDDAVYIKFNNVMIPF